MTKKRRLVFIRHGAIRKPEGINYCPMDHELKLSDETKAEIEGISFFFQSDKDRKVYVSGLTRAQETFNEIAKKNTQLNCIVDNDLNEWFPEELLGREFKEIYEELGEDFEQKWIEKPTIDIFKKSEKIEDAGTRVHEFLKKKLAEEGEVMVISHQTLHQVFLLKILGGDFDNVFRLRLDNLNYSTYEYNLENDQFTVKKVNSKILENIWNEYEYE